MGFYHSNRRVTNTEDADKVEEIGSKGEREEEGERGERGGESYLTDRALKRERWPSRDSPIHYPDLKQGLPLTP